jgi:predicted lactoylglutathione lyase
MSKMIFVNLPVVDLDASKAYKSHFSDNTTACMVWSEAINVMLAGARYWTSWPRI